MLVQKENKIGEIVAQNFRAAQIFESYGLDFCCGGKKTISEACENKGVNPDEVVASLAKVTQNGNGNSSSVQHNGAGVPDYNSWEPDFLVDYIINTHHFYLKNALPNIFTHSQKVASVHGDNHPEVIKIADLFLTLKDELEVHMQKEEKMLFPYIKNLVDLKRTDPHNSHYPPFGTIENPIRVMEAEHDSAGVLLGQINELSSSYTPPDDACTTYKVLYQELNEFENDLHVHIHLENNILFPKALSIEQA